MGLAGWEEGAAHRLIVTITTRDRLRMAMTCVRNEGVFN